MPDSTIYATFAHLDIRYGGVRAYLREAGMTAREPERIGERLL